jgi:UDP-N-acetylmuramate dehydrogenase
MKILTNQPLRHLNSFNLQAKASYFASPANVEAAKAALDFANSKVLPILVLGGGTNIIFSKDPHGLVIKPGMTGRKASFDNNDVYLHVGANEGWTELVEWTLDNQYWGLENLSLIPGTAGAAPVQNIGAYGVELADHLYQVHAIDIKTGQERVFTNSECEFSYRNSRFKAQQKWLITSIILKLSLTPNIRTGYGTIRQRLIELGITKPTPVDVAKAVIYIRQSKLPDPAITPNSGSFFSNPIVDRNKFELLKDKFPGIVSFVQPDGQVKLAAAWLIEQCGLKGFSKGTVGIHPNHALVMINHGKATGLEVMELAKIVQDSVMDRFKVSLEIEPRVI